MKISLPIFGGIRPKASAHLLEAKFGQSAENIDLSSGRFACLAAPAEIQALAGASVGGFFRWEESSTVHWVESAADLDSSPGPLAADPYERRYFTGEAQPRFFANDNVSDPFDATADYIKLGVPAPAAALTAAGYTAGSAYRAYLYTFVNRYGEEGPPSPLLEKSDYGSGNVTLAGFSTPTAGHAVTKIRVYRINASGSEYAEFQLVFATELLIYAATDTYNNGDLVVYGGSLFKCVVNGTTGITPVGSHANWDDWYDGIADAALQPDTLVSEDWEMPPAGLRGLVMLPNGSLAGFVGNRVLISEPNYPHAWPQGTYNDDFTYTMPYTVVAIAVHNTSLVVLTEAKDYLLYGTQPDEMAPREISGVYPCVSKASVASTQYGVIYAANAGMILATPDGLGILTEEILSPAQWAEYEPSTIKGRPDANSYVGFSSVTGFVLDLGNRDFCTHSEHVAAVFLNEDGTLYVVSRQDVDPNDPPATIPWCVKQWAASATSYLYGVWRSKLFISGAATNFGAARVTVDDEFFDRWVEAVDENAEIVDYNAVLFAAGGIAGGLAGSGLNVYGLNGCPLRSIANVNAGGSATFRYYADGALKKEKTISESGIFRLPAGFRAKRHEIEIKGYLPVMVVEIASGMEELMAE